MNNAKDLEHKEPSPKELAKRELAEETAKANVKRYKALLKQKQDAEKVIKNIQREIDDLDLELSLDE